MKKIHIVAVTFLLVSTMVWAQQSATVLVGIPPQQGASVAVVDKVTTLEGTSLELKNFSGKDVTAVQLAWTITSPLSCNSDMQPIYKEGAVQRVEIAPGTSLSIEAPAEIQIGVLLDTAKAESVKALVANVGVLTVTFADGTTWTDQTLASTKQFMGGEVEKKAPCSVPKQNPSKPMYKFPADKPVLDYLTPIRDGNWQCQVTCQLTYFPQTCWCDVGPDGRLQCHNRSCRGSGCPQVTCGFICFYGQ